MTVLKKNKCHNNQQCHWHECNGDDHRNQPITPSQQKNYRYDDGNDCCMPKKGKNAVCMTTCATQEERESHIGHGTYGATLNAAKTIKNEQ